MTASQPLPAESDRIAFWVTAEAKLMRALYPEQIPANVTDFDEVTVPVYRRDLSRFARLAIHRRARRIKITCHDGTEVTIELDDDAPGHVKRRRIREACIA